MTWWSVRVSVGVSVSVSVSVQYLERPRVVVQGVVAAVAQGEVRWGAGKDLGPPEVVPREVEL